MIDIKNCDKIVVETNEKMENIIRWYEDNQEWLDNIEFRSPIPSALVELAEEDIKFSYEPEGVFVRIYLYMSGVYVCNYRYNPSTKRIDSLIFPAGLTREKRKKAQMILAADRTPYKEALKYHSLMCFAAHYRSYVEVGEQREKSLSSKQKKGVKRSGAPTPLITTYRIDNRPIPNAPSEELAKRAYTKPTEQVSVRGFYRTTKTGKRVWVRPFTKYNNNNDKKNKTYKV